MEKAAALWPRLEIPPAEVPAVSTTEKTVTDQHPPEPTPAVPPASAPVVPATAPEPATAAAALPAPGPARITIDQFMAIDLRVAKVLTAERVPKSKKLVKMTVEVGAETRTLVAGIAEAYEPEALVGRSVVIVANLQPATLMGIESNGMVLAASPDAGKPHLVAFDAPAPPAGTRVR
jgi:methionyl-tRNA synthetase